MMSGVYSGEYGRADKPTGYDEEEVANFLIDISQHGI